MIDLEHETPEQKAERLRGTAWWNNMPLWERGYWAERTGKVNGTGGASIHDCWMFYKKEMGLK